MNARGMKRLQLALPNDPFVTPTAAFTVPGGVFHDRLIIIGVATSTITLPAATGSGQYLTFALGSAAAGTTTIIQRAATADRFHGNFFIGVDNATSGKSFKVDATTNANTLTMDGAHQGGISEGDIITFWDKGSGIWYIGGSTIGTATVATPFSNT